MAARPEKFCTEAWRVDRVDQATTTHAHQIWAGKCFQPATVHMETISVQGHPSVKVNGQVIQIDKLTSKIEDSA